MTTGGPSGDRNGGAAGGAPGRSPGISAAGPKPDRPLTFVVCVKPVNRRTAEPAADKGDRVALEAALRLRAGLASPGAVVDVLVMGPPAAEGVARQCLAVGADRAWVLSDPALAGSDAQATARALAAAVRHIGADLVLTGVSSSDGGTGQVGPALATLLGVGLVTEATGLEPAGSALIAGSERLAVRVPLPAVVTVSRRAFAPRQPTLLGIVQARSRPLAFLDCAAVGLDPGTVGEKGSATRVVGAAARPGGTRARFIGGTPREQARAVAELLRARGLVPGVGPAASPAAAAASAPVAAEGSAPVAAEGSAAVAAEGSAAAGRAVAGAPRPNVEAAAGRRPSSPAPGRTGGEAVWVWVESESGRPCPESQEALRAAGRLAAWVGGRVAAWTTESGAEPGADESLWPGPVEEVFLVEPSLGPGATALSIAGYAERLGRPFAFLFPDTRRASILAACVAAALGTGLVSHAYDLRFGPGGTLEALVPAEGGLAVIACPGARPTLITLGPGAAGRLGEALPPSDGDPSPKAPLRLTRVPATADALALASREPRPLDPDDSGACGVVAGGPVAGGPVAGEPAAGEPPDLASARVVVAGGAGAAAAGVWAEVRELARLLGAALGATRPVVDAGLADESRMIGQSGARVSPEVYLALGISGDLQHTVGLEGAGTVVAVNRDPAAPIFSRADYGVVADVAEFVPALVEEVRRMSEGDVEASARRSSCSS